MDALIKRIQKRYLIGGFRLVDSVDGIKKGKKVRYRGTLSDGQEYEVLGIVDSPAFETQVVIDVDNLLWLVHPSHLEVVV